MSKVEMLRLFVQQRLSLAAAEIFEQFERTIAEYEEELVRSQEENERHRKHRDAVYNRRLQSHSSDVQQLLEDREEVPSEQQDWSSSLDQEDPEPPHFKDEQEELWISEEGEQLQGLEEAENEFSPVPMKSEEDELHQTEENREAEGTDADPPSTHDKNSCSSEYETDGTGYWEETQEPQSGSNPLQLPVPGIDCDTGEPSVISPECAGSFTRKGRQRKHTAVQKGEKPFSCSVCSKRFQWKQSLTAHMRLHSEGKHFTCAVCKSSFSFRSTLVDHMRTHTGEKPFICLICNKRFALKQSLKRHLAVHTGEKPFSCSVCGKGFTDPSNLRRHLTTHVGKNFYSQPF